MGAAAAPTRRERQVAWPQLIVLNASSSIFGDVSGYRVSRYVTSAT